MKKFTGFFLVIIMLFTALPVGAMAIESDTSETSEILPSSINTTLDDFVNNKEYYKALAKEGYVIYIDHGDMQPDSAVSQLYSQPSSIDELVSQGRSIYIPQSYWDVATKGAREVKGDSQTDTLYTSVRYYGCTEYEVCITNYYTENLTMYSVGAKRDIVCSIIPGATAYLDLETNSTDKADAFYLYFLAPCDVKGYVGPRS